MTLTPLNERLRFLLIFRHAGVSGTALLKQKDEEMMGRLGRYICATYQMSPNHQIFGILCSEAMPAVQTGQIIAKQINLPERVVEAHGELFSSETVHDTKAALRLIVEKSSACDVIIIVTHDELTSTLPDAFWKQPLRMRSAVPMHPFPAGTGCVFDCKDKTYDIVQY